MKWGSVEVWKCGSDLFHLCTFTLQHFNLYWWSWGESNSRPDKALISFLHVYSSILVLVMRKDRDTPMFIKQLPINFALFPVASK